ATANDNIDGTVSVSVSGVVGSDPGSYTIIYSAADSAGNQSQVSREVVVVARDRTPPVISLIGGTTLEIREGEAFEDPGATATDDRDGNVDITVSGNVGVTIGTYT
ncbi:MAG: immunoglobulin-like domain-containing protein, partial [Halieaceae bacterium]